MAHLYKLIQNTNEHMSGAYQKWYARPVYTGTIDLDGIAELIQRNSTAKKSDAKAVLTEMVEVITDALQSSQRVKIDGFGAFKVGISSRGADSEEDFSVTANIQTVKFRARATGELTSKSLDLAATLKRVGKATASPETPEGGGENPEP